MRCGFDPVILIEHDARHELLAYEQSYLERLIWVLAQGRRQVRVAAAA